MARLSLLNESMTTYYKWMYEAAPEVTRVPGFVFMSVEDAMAYSKDFDDWTYGDKSQKHLFSFKGVSPTQFPIMFGSCLGLRDDRRPPAKLSNQDVNKYMQFFAKQPEDFFMLAAATQEHENMFLALAATVGCLKPKLKSKSNYVYDIEAFYGQSVTMARQVTQMM